MIIKNIKTNFELFGELIDSESLTYLKIKLKDNSIVWGMIDDYREIDHLEDCLEQFRARVLIAYEITNALYEIKQKEKQLPWERDEDWWKK